MKERYSTYKSSGVEWIGEIPKHWEVRKMKYLGTINSGDTLSSELIEEEGEFPVYGGNGVLGYYSQFNYSKPVLSIGRVGEKCGVVHFVSEKVWINDNSLVFETFYSSDNLMYIFYTLRTRNLNSLRNQNTQPLITGTLVKNETIPYPPLPEQEQIVKYLDEKTSQIDGLISITEKKIELLKQKRTSLINEVVTKGLNPDVELKDSGVKWIGERIPKHWGITKLKYIGETIIGLSYTPEDIVDEGQGILVLRSSNIQNGKLSLEDNVYVRSDLRIKENIIVRKGDILICSRNGSRNLIGKNIVIDEKVEGNTFGVFMTVFRSSHWRYLSKVFNSSLFLNQTDLYLTSTINQLTVDTLNGFVIPFPPISEQEQIVEYIDTHTTEIDKLVSIEQRRIETLKEYRQSLISEVVTGKVRVCEEVTQLQES